MAAKKTTNPAKADSGDEETKPALMSVRDAAAYLGIERTTVYRMIRKGKLTPIRVTDDTIRLSRAQVTKIVDSQMPATA